MVCASSIEPTGTARRWCFRVRPRRSPPSRHSASLTAPTCRCHAGHASGAGLQRQWASGVEGCAGAGAEVVANGVRGRVRNMNHCLEIGWLYCLKLNYYIFRLKDCCERLATVLSTKPRIFNKLIPIPTQKLHQLRVNEQLLFTDCHLP